MKTFLFPGQGSQAVGMGATLFDEYPEEVAQADEILGYSIKDLCLNDSNQQLGQTQFTQPAIYVVSALSYFKKMESQDQAPEYFAGHSLGEFNALMAAGCFDFETGLKLVKKRGELMGQAAPGGMAAILNASRSSIEAILKENQLDEIDVANHNCNSQIVISGAKDQIARAADCFQKDRMQYIPLNTGGAFHSRFMKPAKDAFSEYLRGFHFEPLKQAVISNFTARPYSDQDVVSNLSNQITGSVRWLESIEYLLEIGGESADGNALSNMEFEEIGHGDVLKNLIQKILRERRNVASRPTVKLSGPEAKVDQWNKTYPVGTKVQSSVIEQPELETRTEAMVLFQCRAAIYLKGFKGYFDLDELTPV